VYTAADVNPGTIRARLAGRFYGVWFGLLRWRDVPTRIDQESLRSGSVTHVSGI